MDGGEGGGKGLLSVAQDRDLIAGIERCAGHNLLDRQVALQGAGLRGLGGQTFEQCAGLALRQWPTRSVYADLSGALDGQRLGDGRHVRAADQAPGRKHQAQGPDCEPAAPQASAAVGTGCYVQMLSKLFGHAPPPLVAQGAFTGRARHAIIGALGIGRRTGGERHV